MNYIIKVKYEDTLRRLTYPGNRPFGEEVGDFAKLEAKIRDLFRLPASAPIRVTYTDGDNDVITMGDDQDLQDACVYQALNPLRLNVTLVDVKKVGTTEGHSREWVLLNSTPAESNEDAVSTLKDVMKPVIDHVQELLKGTVGSPRQLSELVDSVVHTVTSHIDVAVKKGDVAARSVTTEVSPSFGVPTTPATSQNHATCHQQPANNSLHCGAPMPVPIVRIGSDGVPARNVSDGEVPETGNACRVFHTGVQCDSCGMNPIVGPRFKATKKDDYDLCVGCYKELGNAFDYQRIDRPLFRPRHLRCPALNPNFHAVRVGMPARGPYGSRPEHLRHGVQQTTGFAKLDARFVQDVTIFDGTELAPLTCFTKIWRLRNSGTLAWPLNTKLVHVGGDELGNVDHVPLELPEKGLAPGEEVEVSVDLVAPEKPGRYVSHWRLASPAGPKFGHRVWVLIQVISKERFEDSLLGEISSQSPNATVNKEDTVSHGGPKSTYSDNRAEEGRTLGVQTLQSFLAEAYPTGQSSLETDLEVGSTEDSDNPAEEGRMLAGMTLESFLAKAYATGQSSVHTDVEVGSTEEVSSGSPSELTATVAVDVEGAKIMDAGSLDTDLPLNGNELHEMTHEKDAEFTPTEEKVNQAVVGGGSPSSERNEPLASETPLEYVPALVNSEVGWFSVVDMPQLVSSSSSGLTASTASVEEDSPTSISVPRSVTPLDIPPKEGDKIDKLSLCERLEGMGFMDRKLNLELLEKNNMDLRRTLDEYLFAATEWDPILEELEEMGFYDSQMNRRLMFKNKGSVKRVVKELVQMYKEPTGAAEEKGKGKDQA